MAEQTTNHDSSIIEGSGSVSADSLKRGSSLDDLSETAKRVLGSVVADEVGLVGYDDIPRYPGEPPVDFFYFPRRD